MNIKKAPKFQIMFLSLCFGLVNVSFADTPQTHDVPMFHNDDGLGLLQDCQFMRAIAVGEITKIPTTVNARSTNCLASIKSVVQLLHSVQLSNQTPTTCIPSADLDWLDVLEYVTVFMENQPSEILADRPYGVWIEQAVEKMYQCK